MPGKIEIMIPLLAAMVFGCAPQPGKTLPNSEVGNSPIPLLDQGIPQELATATFALGWFWTPDARFGQFDGVIRTRVGYAGGAKDNPTYSDMGDHSESIEIGYDPKATSYSDLLDIFWNSHLPTARPFSRQYMSIIFYHNEEQRRLALDSKRRQEDQLGMPVFTEIVPARAFTQAEDYHQKFYLRKNRSLMHDLKAMYPDEDGLVDSPAAAKINGFLGGYGTRESLRQILPSLGLSEKARQALLKKGQ